MKNRLIRLALAGGIAVSLAPLAQPAQAWSCTDPLTEVPCFVVGTTCRQLPDQYVIKNVNPRELCTLG